MKWLPSEDEILKKEYSKVTPELIGKKLKRSSSSIYHRVNRLKLYRYNI